MVQSYFLRLTIRRIAREDTDCRWLQEPWQWDKEEQKWTEGYVAISCCVSVSTLLNAFTAQAMVLLLICHPTGELDRISQAHRTGLEAFTVDTIGQLCASAAHCSHRVLFIVMGIYNSYLKE